VLKLKIVLQTLPNVLLSLSGCVALLLDPPWIEGSRFEGFLSSRIGSYKKPTAATNYKGLESNSGSVLVFEVSNLYFNMIINWCFIQKTWWLCLVEYKGVLGVTMGV
jgi:hypothetical protein